MVFCKLGGFMDEEKSLPTVIGEYKDYANFEWAGAKGTKKSWVPWWLWKLVSEPYFEIAELDAVWRKYTDRFQEKGESRTSP
jgi:hypothetical protein